MRQFSHSFSFILFRFVSFGMKLFHNSIEFDLLSFDFFSSSLNRHKEKRTKKAAFLVHTLIAISGSWSRKRGNINNNFKVDEGEKKQTETKYFI